MHERNGKEESKWSENCVMCVIVNPHFTISHYNTFSQETILSIWSSDSLAQIQNQNLKSFLPRWWHLWYFVAFQSLVLNNAPQTMLVVLTSGLDWLLCPSKFVSDCWTRCKENLREGPNESVNRKSPQMDDKWIIWNDIEKSCKRCPKVSHTANRMSRFTAAN